MSQDADTSTGEQSTDRSGGEKGGPRVRSLDTIFELLVSERRRNALYALHRSAEPITLGDLAAEVAAIEETAPERVATALHQVHLPKLADAGVIEYDPEAETVRLTTLSKRFRRYLTSAAEDESRPLGRRDESATLSKS